MRNRSPANSADSSPPVPARISSKTLRSSLGSLGSSSFCSSISSSGRRALAAAISSSAKSRISGSAHRLGFGQIVLGLTEGVELDGHRLDLGAFARQLAELLHIVGRIGCRQHAVDFIETIDQQLQFLANARFHGINSRERVQGA
jgi:hypothetical protein